MPGIIKFSKNEIPEDEAVAAKKALTNNPNSRVVFDFVHKVNRLIRKRVLRDKMRDVWSSRSDAIAEYSDDGNAVYINYYESVSDKDGYSDDCSSDDLYKYDSLCFVLSTLRSWDPDKAAGFNTYISNCIHSYVTDYQLSHSVKMNKKETEEYNEQMRNSPYFDEGVGGYDRKLMVVDAKNFEEVDIAYSPPDESENSEFYKFREGLEKLRDMFEGSRTDMKSLLCEWVIEFLRLGYSEAYVIKEFSGSCFSKDLDICDMVSKYHAWELPAGQFIAAYLSELTSANKSTAAVSRTLNKAYEKLEKAKKATAYDADSGDSFLKRKT